jgi:ABC-type multidrug transport system ATPase subunit
VGIDGKVRRSTPEDELAIRKQVVYLPADAWLPSTRTGREWLLAVGRLYGVDERRLMDHVPRLLALFDLEMQADHPIPSYSTGQRKKLALCGGLITEAPILLLDEPFSGGLDPSGIMALKRLLQFHRERRDRTVVMATPVPELVEELADRIAIIHDGRIVAHDTIPALRRVAGVAGSLDEIYEKLVNPQAAAKIQKYFGEAP